MNRKFAWLVTPLLLACVHLSEAQQPKNVARIGYLSTVSPSSGAPSTKAFREGLAQLGYIEEQNIRVEKRYAEGKLDRLPDLAGELISLKVTVVATRMTPIVMTNVSDPVVLGFVASLARPGENITGLSNLAPELGGKRLELLKEIVPQLSRVAVLGEPGDQAYRPQMKEIEVAAPAFGLQIQPMEL
jgi:putative ABC transport system substrate-binding protein